MDEQMEVDKDPVHEDSATSFIADSQIPPATAPRNDAVAQKDGSLHQEDNAGDVDMRDASRADEESHEESGQLASLPPLVTARKPHNGAAKAMAPSSESFDDPSVADAVVHHKGRARQDSGVGVDLDARDIVMRDAAAGQTSSISEHLGEQGKDAFGPKKCELTLMTFSG